MLVLLPYDNFMINYLIMQIFEITKNNIKVEFDDITFPTQFHTVQAVIFPIVMYECESWTIKKNEHRRIDALELWHWRRLLRVPWAERRSNQSILKEIKISSQGILIARTDAEAEAPIFRTPEQCIGSGKDPDVGKDWGQKKRGAKDEMVRYFIN